MSAGTVPPDAARAPGRGPRPAWTRSPAAFLVLLAIACVVVYLPARNGPFVFDDVRNIVENPSVRMTRLDAPSLWRALVPHENLNLRPLSFLSFALNHLAGGYAPSGYHAVNLAVLLLSIPVAYLLALRLGEAWLPAREARAAALAATTIWALHPLLTNGVSYVVQRMTALYALFSLAALLLFLRGRRSGRPGHHALAVAALLCALASKETALFTPLLAVLLLWLLPREQGGAGARAGWALAGLVAGSQLLMALATGYALRAQWIPAQPFGTTERLLTEGRVVLRYLELFLLPRPSRMSVDHAFPVSTSLLVPPGTLPALALHAALIALALKLRRRRPLFAFGMLAFYLLQLPEGTVLPLDLIFEQRAYLPSFFLALALVDLLLWGFGRLGAHRPGRAALAAAVAAGALCGVLGHARNQVWADPLRLWEDAVSKYPDNARARLELSIVLRDRGRRQEALEQAGVFLALKPNSPEANNNMGVTYVTLGLPEQAVGHLRRAVQLKPGYAEALNNLAGVHGLLGRHEEALEHSRRALALRPGYAKARFNLGLSLLRLGRDAEAKAAWRALREIDPALARQLERQGKWAGSRP